jgi:hypothetical protein
MVYVKFADPTAKPHQTILGAMGIISMNVENIRAKINFARMM